MAKRTTNPVVVDKKKFLLPRMEFFHLDHATGEGFFLKELGGKALLEFKETVEALKANSDEIAPSQAIDLMCKFIALSACDADGQVFFDDTDVALLANKSPNLLMDIANVAMPLSGINAQAFSEVAVDLKNDLPASSSTG